jgi:hypothetical protein
LRNICILVSEDGGNAGFDAMVWEMVLLGDGERMLRYGGDGGEGLMVLEMEAVSM